MSVKKRNRCIPDQSGKNNRCLLFLMHPDMYSVEIMLYTIKEAGTEFYEISHSSTIGKILISSESASHYQI